MKTTEREREGTSRGDVIGGGAGELVRRRELLRDVQDGLPLRRLLHLLLGDVPRGEWVRLREREGRRAMKATLGLVFAVALAAGCDGGGVAGSPGTGNACDGTVNLLGDCVRDAQNETDAGSSDAGGWAAGHYSNVGVVDFSGGACPGVVDTTSAKECPGLPGLAGCMVPASADHPSAIVINCTGSQEVPDARGGHLEPVSCARWHCPSEGLDVCGAMYSTPPPIVSMAECPSGNTTTTHYATDCMREVYNGFDGGTSIGRQPPCRVPVDATGRTLYCVLACP